MQRQPFWAQKWQKGELCLRRRAVLLFKRCLTLAGVGEGGFSFSLEPSEAVCQLAGGWSNEVGHHNKSSGAAFVSKYRWKAELQLNGPTTPTRSKAGSRERTMIPTVSLKTQSCRSPRTVYMSFFTLPAWVGTYSNLFITCVSVKITKNRTETVGVVQMSEAVPEPLCNLKAKKQIWKPVCEKGNGNVSQWERREPHAFSALNLVFQPSWFLPKIPLSRSFPYSRSPQELLGCPEENREGFTGTQGVTSTFLT